MVQGRFDNLFLPEDDLDNTRKTVRDMYARFLEGGGNPNISRFRVIEMAERTCRLAQAARLSDDAYWEIWEGLTGEVTTRR